MIPQIGQGQWVSLPFETRLKLIDIFGIKRSGGVIMADNRVLSDGHTDKDLSVLNVEAMQKYLGVDEADFFKLFNLVLDRLQKLEDFAKEEKEKELTVKQEESAEKTRIEVVEAVKKIGELVDAVTAPRRGRPKKTISETNSQ